MARSLLEIAVEASERDATAPAPTTLFNTNNRIARILRVAAKDIMRTYMRHHAWQGVSELHSTWAFALKPGQYAYPLPPDFGRLIPQTAQRGNWPLGLIGPATPRVWARWISGATAAPGRLGWRIHNNALFVEPTPQTADLVTMEYVSRYLVVSNVQAGDYDLTTKPPTVVAPLVPRDGHIDVPDYETFASLPDDVFGFDNPPGWDIATWSEEVSDALKAINPLSIIAPLPQVRRENFENDTDTCAIADDHILSMGMTAILRRAMGLSYVEHMAEFEDEMESKIAHDSGNMDPEPFGTDAGQYGTYPLEDGRWLIS